MQREIKFRGKRLDNGEWVYGYLCEDMNGDFSIQQIIHKVENGWAIPHRIFPVAPDTVGQYTGIKDARGADIYNGDIIECISSNHIPIRHLIRFCDERGYYAQYDNSNWTGELNECGHICQHYIDKFGKYVIGNIHDNPELLKVE